MPGRISGTHTIDFCFDETTDQRRLKVANIVDEHTREALTMRVGRSCTADDLLVELDRLVDRYGAPSSLRCDNGPELIAWALRDWCRMSRIGISYIEPGSPVGERLRRELQRPRA
jgi:putative transposase